MGIWKKLFNFSYLYSFSALEDKLPYLISLVPNSVPEQDKEKFVRMVSESDPTSKKIYTGWLLKQIQSGQVRLPEDHDKVFEALTFFDKNKLRGGWRHSRDINSFDFYSLSDITRSPKVKQQLRDKGESREGWIYDDGVFAVKKVTTPEEAEHYGDSTEWCTRHPETAKTYLSSGPLYIIFKNDRKTAEMHIPSGQLMNLEDRPYIDHSKEFKKFLRDFGTQELQDADARTAFQYLDKFSLERIPSIEQNILKDPKWAFLYTKYKLKQRWPEAESIIKGTEWEPVYKRLIKSFKEGKTSSRVYKYENSEVETEEPEVIPEEPETIPEEPETIPETPTEPDSPYRHPFIHPDEVPRPKARLL